MIDFSGRGEEHVGFVFPLGLNGGGGGKDDGGVAELADEFEADDGFACAGGGDDVIAGVGYGATFNLGEDEALVFAEVVFELPVGEEGG